MLVEEESQQRKEEELAVPYPAWQVFVFPDLVIEGCGEEVERHVPRGLRKEVTGRGVV